MNKQFTTLLRSNLTVDFHRFMNIDGRKLILSFISHWFLFCKRYNYHCLFHAFPVDVRYNTKYTLLITVNSLQVMSKYVEATITLAEIVSSREARRKVIDAKQSETFYRHAYCVKCQSLFPFICQMKEPQIKYKGLIL